MKKTNTRFVLSATLLVLIYFGFWVSSFWVDYSFGKVCGAIVICVLVSWLVFIYNEDL